MLQRVIHNTLLTITRSQCVHHYCRAMSSSSSGVGDWEMVVVILCTILFIVFSMMKQIQTREHKQSDRLTNLKDKTRCNTHRHLVCITFAYKLLLFCFKLERTSCVFVVNC
jgi:hypothetical protein